MPFHTIQQAADIIHFSRFRPVHSVIHVFFHNRSVFTSSEKQIKKTSQFKAFSLIEDLIDLRNPLRTERGRILGVANFRIFNKMML